MKPWLSDPALAGFAIRVIERVGVEGEASLAARILRSARSAAPSAVAGDIAWALERLRASTRPEPKPPTPRPARARPVTRADRTRRPR